MNTSTRRLSGANPKGEIMTKRNRMSLLAFLFAATLPAASTASDELNGIEGKFGLSAGIGWESYRTPYIRNARILGDERRVLVDDQVDGQAALWLQANYVWNGLLRERFSHSSPGVYVGLRAAGPDSDGLDAFSVGFLWSLSRNHKSDGAKGTDGKRPSVNFGVGPVWHRTRQLATGISAGQALPAEFQQIEFEKRDEVSWMLMVSFGFQ
jgi:hypothetical protein